MNGTPYSVDQHLGVVYGGPAGKTIFQIAREIGATPHSVRNYIQRHLGGMTAWRYSDDLPIRSASGVARLFGVAPAVVSHWIANGHLRATRNHSIAARKRDSGRRQFVIQHEDVLAFLAYRPAWMLWQPSQITDETLRMEAQRLRAAADGEWIKIQSLARAHYISAITLRERVHARGVPFVRDGSTMWIWSTNVSRVLQRTSARQA